MENLKIDFDHWRGSQIADELFAAAETLNQLQVISHIKPRLSIDGNQYCYILGEMPEELCIGFGNTVALAMGDFCKNFWNKKL